MLIQPVSVWEAGNCSKQINLNLFYEIRDRRDANVQATKHRYEE